MIEDSFWIDNYHIKVLYECTCEDLNYILETLRDIDCPDTYIKEAIDNLEKCKLNSGLTYSNLKLKSSVIVIGVTSSFD